LLSEAKLAVDLGAGVGAPGLRVGSGPNITDPIRDPLPGVFKADFCPLVAEGLADGPLVVEGPVGAVPDETGRPRCAAVTTRSRAACAAASAGLAELVVAVVVAVVVAGVAILYLNPRIKFDDKKPHTQVELAQWTNIVMMN